MTYEAFTKLYCFDCKHSTYGELISEVGADAICMLHNYPCDDVKDCPEFDDTDDEVNLDEYELIPESECAVTEGQSYSWRNS